MSVKAQAIRKKSAGQKKSKPSPTNSMGSVDLIWIAMAESSFSGDRDEYFNHKEHRRSLSWSCKAILARESCFEIRSDFSLSVFPVKSNKCFFDLKVSHILHLHGSGQFDQSDVESFADTEARVVMWPFIREYVISTCGRMHVPPILLPFEDSEDND